MKKITLLFSFIVLFTTYNAAQAQDTLLVAPGLGTLNAAINEHGGNKIYKLEADKWYQINAIIENVDYHLQIIGEKPVGNQMPATVQTNVDAGGAVFQRMFDAKGDVTFKNIYFVNASLTGSYGMRFLFQSKDGARTHIQNCIIDPVGIADMVYVTSVNNRTYLYDNLILRHGHLNHFWDGQVVSHDAGQNEGLDTLIVENNTIVSVGTGLHNTGFARNVDNYVRFNHNTLIMHKVNLDWSAWDEEYYFTNNLLFDAAARPTPHSWNLSMPGIKPAKPNFPLIMADTIPGEALPSSRMQYVQYNLLYRNPKLYELVDELNELAEADGHSKVYLKPLMWPIDSIDVSREVCLFNNEDDFPYFLYGNTFTNVDPEWEEPLIYEYSDKLYEWTRYVSLNDMGYETPPSSQWPNWHWDLDGDPSINEAWPVINARYNHPDIRTGSIAGLPLGDLNWFPEARAIYEENRDLIEAHIHAGNTDKLIVTSTNPDITEPAITVFPNPVKDILTVNMTADMIRVYSLTGSIIKTARNTNQVNVSGFNKGMYIVRVDKDDRTYTSRIIIIK